MIADYAAEIKIAIFQWIWKRQRDEWRSSSNCGRIAVNIARFNSVNAEIIGQKFTKFGYDVAWLLPLNILKVYSWPANPLSKIMIKQRVMVVPCDADCTSSYVLNSGVTDLNLTKFLQGVQKWLPITLLKPNLRISNPFGNANVTNEDRRQIAGESRKNCAFEQRKLRDYWTEVHPIRIQCSLIIAIKPVESRLTIGQSIVECRSKE